LTGGALAMPVRVAVFAERSWPEGSGGELATFLLLRGLAGLDWLRVTVYTGTRRPLRVPGAEYRFLPELRARGKLLLWARLWASMGRLEELARGADVVYVPGIAYPVITAARRAGRRVVVHLHGFQPVAYNATLLTWEEERPLGDVARTVFLARRNVGGWLRWLVSAAQAALGATRLARALVEHTDAVICVSRRHCEALGRLAPELARRGRVVYNPLPPLPPAGGLAEEPLFLYLGGDSFIKGFEVLASALLRLGRRGLRGARLVLANRYSPRSRRLVEGLARRYGLRVEVAGRLPHRRVLELLGRAWGLLFPSVCVEPLPYAVLEAAAMAAVPVASRVGGVEEVVAGTGAEGFLCPPGDPECIADSVERLFAAGRGGVEELGEALAARTRRLFEPGRLAARLARVLVGEL
jgi:glycosyltransferase involved in cell wall biosynthesis